MLQFTEIVLLVPLTLLAMVGLLAVIRGKFTLAPGRAVKGRIARFLGVLAVVPTPVVHVLNLVLKAQATSYERRSGEVSTTVIIIEVAFLLGTALLICLIGTFYAEKEPGYWERRRMAARRNPVVDESDEASRLASRISKGDDVTGGVLLPDGDDAPHATPPARRKSRVDVPDITRQENPSTSPAILIGVVVGVFLLLGAATAIGIVLTSRKEEPEKGERGPTTAPRVPEDSPKQKGPGIVIPDPEPNRHTEGPLRPGSPLWAALRQKTIRGERTRSPALHGKAGTVEVVCQGGDGGLLIGFHVTVDQFVTSVQPIYLTAKGETLGPCWGQPRGTLTTIKARRDYAVGAVEVRAGDILDGLRVVFMKVGTDSLDPADTYRSEQVGGMGGTPFTASGDGAFLVGVHARTLDRDHVVPRGAPTTLGVISITP